MPSGDYLLEYNGELLSARGANRRFARSQVEEGYGFFFGLEGGRTLIDYRLDAAKRPTKTMKATYRCASSKVRSSVCLKLLEKGNDFATTRFD
jgi:hypothetical protein